MTSCDVARGKINQLSEILDTFMHFLESDQTEIIQLNWQIEKNMSAYVKESSSQYIISVFMFIFPWMLDVEGSEVFMLLDVMVCVNIVCYKGQLVIFAVRKLHLSL